MSAVVENPELARTRLREAAAWRLAGLLFRRPIPSVLREVEALASELGGSLPGFAVPAEEQAREGVYHGWLGPGGAVSPRAVSYRPLEDPGRLLAEIAAFHREFAYRAVSEDPSDHVAVSADFLGYLSVKEAYAVAAGRSEDAATTAAAHRSFRDRHVVPTARGMLQRFARCGALDTYLACAAREMLILAGADPDSTAAESEPDPMSFVRPGLDDGTFECGAACPWNDGSEPPGPCEP